MAVDEPMAVLVAEDDPTSLHLLTVLLTRWGYQVLRAQDGARAWELLQKKHAPRLVILDWMMPELDGLEICRRLRAQADQYTYVILLTAKEEKQDIITGLDAGADDYVTKPFHQAELRSRIRSGERIVRLKMQLQQKVTELEDALVHVQQLQGMMPICMHCHRIRDDDQIWHRLEEYIQEHSEAVFTHALCRDCLTKHYPEVAQDMQKKEKNLPK